MGFNSGFKGLIHVSALRGHRQVFVLYTNRSQRQ